MSALGWRGYSLGRAWDGPEMSGIMEREQCASSASGAHRNGRDGSNGFSTKAGRLPFFRPPLRPNFFGGARCIGLLGTCFSGGGGGGSSSPSSCPRRSDSSTRSSVDLGTTARKK